MRAKPILTTFAATLLVSGTSLAAAPASDMSTLAHSIQRLTVQSASMQREIRSLRTQLKTLKAKRSTRRVSNNPHNGYAHNPGRWYQRNLPTNTRGEARYYTQGVTVTTSPFLGIRSAFNASDLVTNLPTLNEDLRLLKQRQTIEKNLGLAGTVDSQYPLRPLIEFSGKLEAEAIMTRPFAGATRSDIDLTSAELDTMVEFGPWVTGLLSINYDNAPPATGARVTNSNLRLDRGFFTIGNLNRSPFYTTIGQMFVPFGEYSSMMVTTLMTQSVARAKERAIVLGYSNDGWSGQIYAFKGDTFSSNSGIINNGGANLGYTWGTPASGGHFGAGIIANIADSEGMQATGAAAAFFGGFGATVASQMLVNRVPAVDVHFKLSEWQYDLIAEYIRTTRSFSAADLSFNGAGSGARVDALNVEFGRRFHNFRYPLGVAIGFQQTHQALGLNLPWRSFVAAMSTSLWQDTIQAIEYRHDINYRSTDMATGNNGATTITGGGTRNIVTAKMGVYF